MTEAGADATAYPLPQTGELTRLTPQVRRLIAHNASPYTHTGTCSYIVGVDDVVVIDPGPADEAHIAALLTAVAGERVRAILVTHTHRDHSPAAAHLRATTGAPIVGAAPHVFTASGESGLDSAHDRDYAPDRVLKDGEAFTESGLVFETISTPGHTANHLCFAFAPENALFSGDHVMAWSTSIVAPPDGTMSDYLESLDKLRERPETIYWPGHGGPVTDPHRYVRGLATHRRARETMILNRLAREAGTPPEIVKDIYVGLDPRLLGAAAMSTLAHLIHMRDRSLVEADEADTLHTRYRRK